MCRHSYVKAQNLIKMIPADFGIIYFRMICGLTRRQVEERNKRGEIRRIEEDKKIEEVKIVIMKSVKYSEK